jgi:hypothetical protein
VGKTPLGNFFRRRQLQPIGLADEYNPSGAEALRQKFDGADDSPADPRGAETGCHTDPFGGYVAGSVAVDELDVAGNAEFFSAALRLIGEQLAHVDTSANNSVIACPGAQHLARAAAEVEDAGPLFQAQCLAESSEFVARERVVDAMSTFCNVEDLWNVHCEISPYGCE